MGALDANGVWIYDDNDHVVPISAYENLGQQSISLALEDLRDDLTNVPNVSAITAASGYTSTATSEVTSPGWIGLSGAITRSAGSPIPRNTLLATIPVVAHRPGATVRLSAALGNGNPASSGTTVIQIGTNGQIVALASTTELTPHSILYLNGIVYKI